MNVLGSSSRRLRAVLVWLLVAALPWPALAAVRTADCCPTGRAMSTIGALPSTAHAAPESMTMADDASPARHASHAPAHDGKCGACAACVAGVVSTASPLRVPSIDRTDGHPATVASRIVAGFRDGPDRPPPSSLA